MLRILRGPRLLGSAKSGERRAKRSEVVQRRFGFEAMAKRSLGATFTTLSPAWRTHSIRLFTDPLERSYIARSVRYSGQSIVYTGASVEGDLAEVDSTISERLGDRTTIVYRLLHRDREWPVYDLTIDGVSLVNDYHVHFGQTLRTSTHRALVEKMRRKLASEEADERPVAAPAGGG